MSFQTYWPQFDIRGASLITHADFDVSPELHAPDVPPRTLSPVSSNAMNSLKIVTSHSSKSMTIINSSESNNDLMPSKGIENTVPRASSNGKVNGNSVASHGNIEWSALPRSNSFTPVPTMRTISSEFGVPRSYPAIPIAEDAAANDVTSPQWSSAVGRANLGKSGRVIERLMSENDMLKRELQIEKLRADESKQAVKMAEGKMEALVSEYEGRLHDAAVNKTLLKRRERQLAELKAQIDGERSRADTAVERERGWREAMEKTEVISKQKVEEATNFSLLMEGRNKALSSHWKEQGALVDSTVSRLQVEITAVMDDRRSDCMRMDSLQDICNQQSDSLLRLEAEKEAISEAFKRYKAEQEALLQNIKARARAQEKANEDTLMETQKVLGELKWALAVNKNVRDTK